jgi:hypothetical protein
MGGGHRVGVRRAASSGLRERPPRPGHSVLAFERAPTHDGVVDERVFMWSRGRRVRIVVAVRARRLRASGVAIVYQVHVKVRAVEIVDISRILL